MRDMHVTLNEALRSKLRGMFKFKARKSLEILDRKDETGRGVKNTIGGACPGWLLWRSLCPPNPGEELLPYLFQSLGTDFSDGSHK